MRLVEPWIKVEKFDGVKIMKSNLEKLILLKSC